MKYFHIFLIFALASFSSFGQNCTVSANQTTICSGQSSLLTITHDLPQSSTISWSQTTQTSNTITVTPTSTTNYSCTVTDGSNSCVVTITITVNSIPSITSTTPESRCDAGTVNLNAVASAGDVNWFTSPTGGTSLNTGNTYSPNISATTIFYVDATNNGCISPRTAVTATINLTPSITSLSQTICSSNSFSITPTNGSGNIVPTNTTYTWSAPSIPGITGTLSANNASIISGTLTNNTNAPVAVSYSITPTSGSCQGSSFNTTITVNPTPSITSLSQPICSSNSFSITPTNGSGNIVPTNTTYSWSAPSVPGITGALSANNASIISGTLTNNTNAPVAVSYSITPTSGSCQGSSFNTTITVNPTPSITSLSQLICSSNSFSITPTNGSGNIVPNNTTYSWSAPSISGITGALSANNANTINGTLTNTTNVPVAVTYSVTPTSGSCQGSSFNTTITVNPRPSISGLSQPICSGNSFSIAPTNGGGNIVPSNTTFSWSAPSIPGITGALSGNNLNTINGTLTNTTNSSINATYIITPTSGSCFGSSFNIIINVNPKPNVITSQSDIRCSGEAFSIIPFNGSGNIIPSGTTYSWSAPTVLGITGTAGGTSLNSINGNLINTTNISKNVVYTVTPTSGSCPGTNFSATVIIKPRPTIASNVQEVCSNTLFQGNWGTPNIVPSITNYTWSVVNNTQVVGEVNNAIAQSFGQTLTNLTLQNQIVVYTVTPVSDGCIGNPFTLNLDVKPAPIADAGQDFTKTCLTNSNGSSIGSASIPGYTYLWQPVSNLSSSSVSNPFANPTSTTTYTLTVSEILSGCSATDQATVTVDNISPVANAGMDGNITCTLNTNGFTIGMPPTVNTSYSWSPINGLAASNSSSTIANPNSTTQYTVVATNLSNGCSESDQILVTVNQDAPISNAGSDFTKTCISNINGNTIGMNAVAGITYSWFPSTGLSSIGASNPIANPSQTTLFTLTSTDVVNGCTSTDQILITVNNELPIAYAGLDALITCNQNVNGAVIGMQPVNGINYSWSPSTGLSSINQSQILAHPNQNSNYTLTATNPINGCVQTDTVNIIVDTVAPTVNAGSDVVVCEGQFVQLSGSSNSSNVSWSPSFMVQNVNDLNTTATINGSTTFTLTAIGSNGCIATDVLTAQIAESPLSSLLSNYIVCENETINLTVSPQLTCNWSGLYTGTQNDIAFIGTSSGNLNLETTNNNGCTSSETITITVNPIPYPITTGAQAICQNSYWETYSIPSTSNQINWTVTNGNIMSSSNANDVVVHWGLGTTGTVNVTETISETGCSNDYTYTVLLGENVALDTAEVLQLSSSVLYTPNDYSFMNWGYESIITQIPVSIGVYSQYCEFPNFNPSLNYYWVEIGDGNGCITKSYFNNPNFVANIQNTEKNNVEIYPNPTEALLNIETDLDSFDFEIINLDGQKVMSGSGDHSFTLPIIEIPSGIYFMSIKSEGYQYNQKIIKL